eukprot:TCONS_00047010-protein
MDENSKSTDTYNIYQNISHSAHARYTGQCFTPIQWTDDTHHRPSYNLHRISSIFIGIPLFIIGIITDIVCTTLWKRLMNRARNRNITCGIYLNTIAIIDIGTLLGFLTCDILVYANPNILQNHTYNQYYAIIGYPSYTFFMFLNFWLIAGVDACRLTMVLYPIKLRQSETRITNIAISLIITVMFAVNIPNFFAYGASYTANGIPCRWLTALSLTESFKNYIFGFQCVFLTVVPWFVILLVNISMNIYQSTVPDYIPKSKQKAVEMGQLLRAMSIYFITIIFCQCLVQCFFLRTHQTSDQWERVDSVFAFAKLGVIIYSSTKFFLFVTVSKTFRKAFLHMFSNPRTVYALVVARKERHNRSNKDRIRNTLKHAFSDEA